MAQVALARLQGGAVSEEQHEVRAASAGLGLAVLAGFSRVSELAQSQDLIQNVPLLLKVGGCLGAGDGLFRHAWDESVK